jgi:hypothetical protein
MASLERAHVSAASIKRPLRCESNSYSFSNPRLVNFSVRLFSVTVRTTWSGAPDGISAWISSVTVTFAPTRPERCTISA